MEPLQGLGLEALDVDPLPRLQVAVAPQNGEHGGHQILALGLVPGGLLELQVDPGLPARGSVEPADQGQLLVERVESKGALAPWVAGREAPRKVGCPVRRVQPLPDPQPSQLLPGEVDGIPMAVRPGPLGVTRRHVRDGVQGEIMEHQGYVVPAQHHVLLQEIRAHSVGQGLGLQGMLRQVARGPPVGDDNGWRRCAHGAHHPRRTGLIQGPSSSSALATRHSRLSYAPRPAPRHRPRPRLAPLHLHHRPGPGLSGALRPGLPHRADGRPGADRRHGLLVVRHPWLQPPGPEPGDPGPARAHGPRDVRRPDPRAGGASRAASGGPDPGAT